MDSGSLAAGALRGVVGAMSMTGYRTLAAQLGCWIRARHPSGWLMKRSQS
jgi:hypothetical protein